MGLAAVFSLLIYSRYNLPRSRHEEILQALKDRLENQDKEHDNAQSIAKE